MIMRDDFACLNWNFMIKLICSPICTVPEPWWNSQRKLKVTWFWTCAKKFYLKEAWAMLLLLLWQLSSLRLLVSDCRPCKLPPQSPQWWHDPECGRTQNPQPCWLQWHGHQTRLLGSSSRGSPRQMVEPLLSGRAVGAGLGTALVLWCLLAEGPCAVQLPEEPESITFNVSESSHYWDFLQRRTVF